jgi:hypothetical protein
MTRSSLAPNRVIVTSTWAIRAICVRGVTIENVLSTSLPQQKKLFKGDDEWRCRCPFRRLWFPHYPFELQFPRPQNLSSVNSRHISVCTEQQRQRSGATQNWTNRSGLRHLHSEPCLSALPRSHPVVGSHPSGMDNETRSNRRYRGCFGETRNQIDSLYQLSCIDKLWKDRGNRALRTDLQ